MRSLWKNKKGVSNVLGYLLSFSIASIVMVSAVVITTGIINNRTATVAELQAQSIANKVADALVEAFAVDQSMPDADYTKTLDLPVDIAGRSYYIEVTDKAVYVNTTDDLVSKSSPAYGAGKSKTGVSGERIYSGSRAINISIERSDVVYQFDFGTGNNTKHSPVEAGYYLVSNTSSAFAESLDPPWWNQDYPYRIPIQVTNEMDQDIDEAVIKVTLSPTNFNYDHANVTNTSSSSVTSNLVFVDDHFSVIASMEVTPKTWYMWWYSRETDDVVDIHIGGLSEGYDIAEINVDTVRLNNQLPWDSWDGTTFSFDAKAAFMSLTSSRLGKKYTPPTPGTYTISLSGLLNDGTPFSGRNVITVADGDLLVSKEFNEHTPGWGITRFDTIQTGIAAANTGDVIYVYEGTYNENIVINKQIRLFGEDKESTIIDGSAGNDVVTMTTNADKFKLDSFTIRGGSGTDGRGIFMDYVTGFTISNCNIHSNKGNGIHIKRADDGSSSTIKNCNVYFNGNVTEDDGIRLWNVDYLSIINCTSHDNGPAAGEHDADGIALEHSHYNLIKDCQFYNNNDDGINLVIWSSNNTINNCTLYDNYDAGIVVNKKSNDNKVMNCEVYDCKYGVAITTDSYVCSDNVVTNCNIRDNSMAGVILQGETASNCVQYNTISHCEIYNNAADGIIFWTYAKHNTVEYCNIHHNAYGTEGNGGIEIYGGNNNTIIYCDVHHNTNSGAGADGIGLVGSLWNTIKYCTFHHNDWGGCVTASGLNNRFEWCRFYENANDGFYTEGGSNTNVIENCDVYANGQDGISLKAGCVANFITSCNVFDNVDDGIQILGSSENQIGYNNIFGNDQAGIYLDNAPLFDNVIYQNNIEYNDLYEAYADSIGFQWDTGIGHPLLPWETGNYWGDFDVGNHHLEVVTIGLVTYYDVYEVSPLSDGTKVYDRYPENDARHGSTERFYQRNFIQVDDDADPSWYDYYHVETITEAISHVTTDGTIYIYNGIYDEQCTINKMGITIFGESRENVIIDGEGARNGIQIAREDTTITSLTVRNGNPCGISIAGKDDVTITDCDITSTGSAHYGLYIYAGSERALISDCDISTTDKGNEYGIFIWNTGGSGPQDNVITNCKIYNHGEHGIFLDEIDAAEPNEIADCEIYANGDSGIYFDDNSDNNKIFNCEIYNNDNYGLMLDGHSDANDIANCTFYDNGISGIYVKYSHGNTFTNCECYNDGGTDQEYGVRLEDDAIGNEFTDCKMYLNNQHGVYIYDNSDLNEITNCDIYSNADNGIHIQNNANQNKIINCQIYDNDNYGVYIYETADANRIQGCDIYNNYYGTCLEWNADGNIITGNMLSKNWCGIFIIDDADGNTITNCEISDNNYGININDSTCNSNEIYYNNFKNCTPRDEGTNQWDSDDYLTGGNHWDEYDEGWEGAYDFYTGFDQNILGSDGKVDTPYNISGKIPENQDRWPLGGGRYNVRPYYIDYWNPYGESIILVKMNLKSQREHPLYLYYGYDQPLTDIHNHTIDEVSAFFDDFENPPGPSPPYNIETNWDLSPTSGDINNNITDGCLKLTTKEFIMTKDFSISPIADPSEGQPPSITANESSYSVEARMKVNEGQGNMMVLGNYLYEETTFPFFSIRERRQWYVISANSTPNTNLTIYKRNYYKPYWLPPSDDDAWLLTEEPTIDVTDWLRMKTFLYTGKIWYKPDTGDPHKDHISRITAYLYHYDTFADVGDISGIDTYWYETGADGEPVENAVGEPYMEGEIGLGCGLMSSEDGECIVDWIRVLKTPAVLPTITIGSPESAEYGWGDTDGIQATNILTFNPFTPGPVLRDYNYGSGQAVFRVNLPADDYVITITRGNYSGTCDAMNATIPGGTLRFPESGKGEYETKWLPVHHSGGDLDIVFHEAAEGKTWLVNAIIVERGGKGIRVGLE